MLEDADSWEASTERALYKWRDAASDGAAHAELVFNDTMKGMEDVFAKFVVKGELNFDQLTDRVLEDLARIFWEKQVMGPSSGASRKNRPGGCRPLDPHRLTVPKPNISRRQEVKD
jgi:phage-related minor tail protein